MNSSRACARLLAVPVLLVFLVATVLVLLAYRAEQYFFNPDSYKEAFLEMHVYDQIPRLISFQIVHNMTYNPCEEDPERCEDEAYGASACQRNHCDCTGEGC